MIETDSTSTCFVFLYLYIYIYIYIWCGVVWLGYRTKKKDLYDKCGP